MRKYETIFISDPDLNDQDRSDLFDKVRSIISKENGLILDFDDWGNKKLAYEIKKKLRGHYVCVTYGGNGALVDELERNFRLTDDVLKFMTIVLSEDTTAEELEKEIVAYQEKSKKEPEEESEEDVTDEEASEDDDESEDDDGTEEPVDTENETE